jgi:secreted trypsin-like serine protease
LQNLRSALTDGYNMQASNNLGRDGGGTCFGDSGGPVFLDGSASNLIVGVTSFGLSANTCRGVDFSYRLDQQAVIDWIRGTVPDEWDDISFASP